MLIIGSGILNSVINKLPFELHLPGYQFCGPGTKLQKRLQRGDPGINSLDSACKQHDIAYSQNKNVNARHKADKILEEAAWQRVKSADATLGEKTASLLVTGAMKVKRKLGMGIKLKMKKDEHHKHKSRKNKKIRKNSRKKMTAFRKGVIMKAKTALKQLKKVKNIDEGSSIALAAAKAAVKKVGGRSRVRKPRIIPIPKQGGILPLIPLFAGLSALGTLTGGAAGIASAVNKAKDAQKRLEESQRHNKTMEAIALGKTGNGLYLKPYRKGLGLYLTPYSKN